MSALVDAKSRWFSESEVLWPGQKFCLKVQEDGILYSAKSDFQQILVFESETYGRVLVLDGVIQMTERDEFAYQEMIAHVPLFAHSEPKRVLIVGGGDGGVLREVARHASVEAIDMCEIDRDVIEVSKEYFGGSTACSFDDPRLNLVCADAAEFLEEVVEPKPADKVISRVAADAATKVREDPKFEGYDAIIVDSSDPVGPAESLFRPQFYEAMRAALAPNGIVCTQGECMWLHMDLIGQVVAACGDIFPQVEYAFTCIPTYPSGSIGFVLCSLDPTDDAVKHPKRHPPPEMQDQLRYYNPAIHTAAFALPQFANLALQAAKN